MEINTSISIDEEQKYEEAAKRLIKFADNNSEQIKLIFSKNENFNNIGTVNGKYKEFQRLFSLNKLEEIIKKVENEEIQEKELEKEFLYKFFLHEGDTNNLCYKLEYEYDKLGGISGGSSDKFKLYKSKKDDCWKIYKFKSEKIDVNEDYDDEFEEEKGDKIILTNAIQQGKDIVKSLLEGGRIINDKIYNNNLNTITDYNELYNKLKNKNFQNLQWVKKYYHMLFPEYFCNWFSDDKQKEILYSLGIKEPADNFYGRSYELIKIYNYVNELRRNSNLEEYNQVQLMSICTNFAKNFYIFNTDNLQNFDFDRLIKFKEIAIKCEEIDDIKNIIKDKKLDSSILDFYKAKNNEEENNTVFLITKDGKIKYYFDKIEEYKFENNFLIKKGNLIETGITEQYQSKSPKFFYSLNIPQDEAKKKKHEFLSALFQDYLKKSSNENIPMNNQTNDINSNEKSESKHSLNTILYGPPGTGKTYHTLYHALSIIDNKEIDADKETDYESLKRLYDEYVTTGRIKSITFHQSYGYEDFIEGIKPVCAENENEKTTNQDSESKDIKYKNEKTTNQDSESKDIKYKIEDGVFKDFCNNKAKKYPNNNYVFIIDEINRGNISNIFGELITLIEPNKREGNPEATSVTLPYSKKPFSVPNNVYIIGTMNTADRSIALLDTALRRRFDFIEMMPDPEKLGELTITHDNKEINIKNILETMNKRIEVLYDREHTIGHAYFMPLLNDPTFENLKNIFKNRIIPLLQEYFYEDYRKIQLVLGDNKKDDDNKFIKDVKIDSSLFGEEIGDLPENKYEINENAFNNPTSYIQIYNTEDENKQQNS